MSWWLISGWFLLLFTIVTFWLNHRWTKLQRQVAGLRPNLDRRAYIEELASSEISEEIAGSLYDALLPSCVKGVAPHPDDGLMGFYFDDPEDMEDLIEEMFRNLGLPMPTRYAPETTPHLQNVRELAAYLQSKLDR